MKHIGAHLKRSIKEARTTERGELLEYFCDRLNTERVRDGYSKFSLARMGKTLEKIPTKDLYYLKTVCDDASNFSKKFWYLLAPEKYERPKK